MNEYKIASIAGDGIGKEVLPESIKVLNEAAKKHQFKIKFDEFPTSPELSGFNEYLDDDDNKQLRSKGYKNNAFQSYDVETVTLNDLIAENTEKMSIDYISIDTEGSEYEIIKNFIL